MKTLLLLAILSLTKANEADIQEFTTGNNLFTGAIYKEVLKEKQENFLVSPFSIETVLALTQSGAKDDTASEIRNGLHLPNSKEATEAIYKDLLPKVKGNKDYALHTANKIYVKNNYPLNGDFQKVASDIYQAGIESVDFSQKDVTTDIINKWVEKHTENKIHDLIEPKNLDEDTRVILINALYFKGKWLYPFETASTHKKDFYKSSKEVIQVDTMHNIDLFNYHESPELNAKFLELPYQGDDVSMVIILPNEKDGLSALESQIDKVFLAPNFTQERVSVSLPKFTIDNKINLKEILKKLGIKKAFSEDADFSGMAGKKGELYISDVLQKAFINVTETGTEAAAATAVIGMDRIGTFGPDAPIEFNVDHAFLYYIKITGHGILFCGRITTPL